MTAVPEPRVLGALALERLGLVGAELDAHGEHHRVALALELRAQLVGRALLFVRVRALHLDQPRLALGGEARANRVELRVVRAARVGAQRGHLGLLLVAQLRAQAIGRVRQVGVGRAARTRRLRGELALARLAQLLQYSQLLGLARRTHRVERRAQLRARRRAHLVAQCVHLSSVRSFKRLELRALVVARRRVGAHARLLQRVLELVRVLLLQTRAPLEQLALELDW